MRAAVMADWQMTVEDIDVPRPGPGQVLTAHAKIVVMPSEAQR